MLAVIFRVSHTVVIYLFYLFVQFIIFGGMTRINEFYTSFLF
jgi:hypothetical protein